MYRQEKEERNNVMNKTTIRIPDKLKQEIQQEADRRNISFNAMILIWIEKGRQKG